MTVGLSVDVGGGESASTRHRTRIGDIQCSFCQPGGEADRGGPRGFQENQRRPWPWRQLAKGSAANMVYGATMSMGAHESETRSEARIAREIQRNLLPPVPRLDGFDIGAAMHPLSSTGGDFFDFIPMLDGSLGIVVGDACGHGVGAALLMATTRAYLRAPPERIWILRDRGPRQPDAIRRRWGAFRHPLLRATRSPETVLDLR
jgi:hypothetical protein